MTRPDTSLPIAAPALSKPVDQPASAPVMSPPLNPADIEDSIFSRAKPVAERLIAAARDQGGGSEALLRACRHQLSAWHHVDLPKMASWLGVIDAAAAIRDFGRCRPVALAIESAVTAKAIDLAVDGLKSKERRAAGRARNADAVDWAWVGSCRLCHRTAPMLTDKAEPHFCSVHRPGSSAYKYAMKHRARDEVRVRASYAAFTVTDSPQRDFLKMPFREWLARWFPSIAVQYAETDASSLVAVLDDGDAPEDAKQRHHAIVTGSAKRLTAFLVEAQCWLEFEPAARHRVL